MNFANDNYSFDDMTDEEYDRIRFDLTSWIAGRLLTRL
jgi:hypothetical protein